MKSIKTHIGVTISLLSLLMAIQFGFFVQRLMDSYEVVMKNEYSIVIAANRPLIINDVNLTEVQKLERIDSDSVLTRLKDKISNENLEKIFQFIYSGELKDVREQVIYCDRKNNNIVTPKDLITQELARNLLLFAIESFDDNLVGWTNYSIELSKKTDLFFEIIANSKMK